MRLDLAVDRSRAEPRGRWRRRRRRWLRPGGPRRGLRSRCAAAFPGNRRSRDGAATARGCARRRSISARARSRRSRDLARWPKCRGSRAACAPGSAEDRRGTASPAPSVTTSANSFSSIRSQALNMNTPPGRSTRRASAKAFALSGKNITPNWQTTASKLASSNGSCMASAWSPLDRSRGADRARLIEHRLDSGRWRRSRMPSGSAAASRARDDAGAGCDLPARAPDGGPPARSARSPAYGSKISGTRYFS